MQSVLCRQHNSFRREIARNLHQINSFRPLSTGLRFACARAHSQRVTSSYQSPCILLSQLSKSLSHPYHNIHSPVYYQLRHNFTTSTSGPPRAPKLRIIDLLQHFPDKVFYINQHCSINDAIRHLVREKLGSLVVTDNQYKVIGIFTARDILKFIATHSTSSSSSSSSASFTLSDTLQRTKITEIMTKREKLVYCSPGDSVRLCREVMFQLKIRNLPILDPNDKSIKGIVTMKTLADSNFNLVDVGGKKGFFHNVTGRKGLPETAHIVPSASAASSSSPFYRSSLEDALDRERWTTHRSMTVNPSLPQQPRIDVEVGAFALPHPFKTKHGVSNTQRDYGAMELATDQRLSEDAFFAIRLRQPHRVHSLLTKGDAENNKSQQQLHHAIHNEFKELNALSPFDPPSSSIFPSTNPHATPSSSSSNTPCTPPIYSPITVPLHLPVSSVPQEESQVYLCVADGVGSWRQFDIDPRQFAHT